MPSDIFWSFHLFFCFFWPYHVAYRIPDQELNLCPLQWKHGVLTTGPPGNSLVFSFRKCWLQPNKLVSQPISGCNLPFEKPCHGVPNLEWSGDGDHRTLSPRKWHLGQDTVRLRRLGLKRPGKNAPDRGNSICKDPSFNRKGKWGSRKRCALFKVI